MIVRRPFLSVLASLLLLVVPLVAHAETKILNAEATYLMGDGETPSFAEAMAIQKAKQMALEQAGTYVESYTKIRNLDLTTEEIQTIAGGVLKVEVQDKSRTLIGDGLRFYVKINASVTTDKMEELAHRIKGKNVAEEYKKLQEDYARLANEIETWKQLVAKTPPGPEREAALDQIRDREKAFSSVQQSETVLFQRLVSGTILTARAHDVKAEIERLVESIKTFGHVIEVGRVTAFPASDSPTSLVVTVPVKLRISSTLVPALVDVAKSLGGYAESIQNLRLATKAPGGKGLNYTGYTYKPHKYIIGDTYTNLASGVLIRLSKEPSVQQYFQERVADVIPILRYYHTDGTEFGCALSMVEIKRMFAVEKIKFSSSDYDFANDDKKDLLDQLMKYKYLVADSYEGGPFGRATPKWQPDLVSVLLDEARFFVEVKLHSPTTLERIAASFGDKKDAPREVCRLIVEGGS